jgi:hypothetical protein
MLITIDDLLKNKKVMEEKANKTLKLHLKELNGDVEVRKITFEEFLEIQSNLGDDEIIYNCCKSPNFKSDELINALEVKENPVEGVQKVLSRKTIKRVAAEILKFSDLISNDNDLVTIVENDIKN